MSITERSAALPAFGAPVDTMEKLKIPDDVPDSRVPTDDELRLIREVIDPNGLRYAEVPNP